MNKVLQFVKNNLLLILLLCSLCLGIGLGAIMRGVELNAREKMYFRFPGDLLMRMLKMLIIPLIVSSLVSGLAGLDAKASGKMGLRAVVYYMSTTFIAVVLGIILVVTIKPGSRTNNIPDDDAKATQSANIADSFLDLIRNMFPDNIIEACFKQTKTEQIPIETEKNITIDVTDMNGNKETIVNGTEMEITYDFNVEKQNGMNVLGLVVFSVALGIVISRLGEVGKPLYNVFFAMAEASMSLVIVIIWYSPVGILFLVASEIVNMKDPVAELEALGLYIATVVTGLIIHGFIILPTLYFIFVRKNPFVYIYGILQAMATALGTASSSATLPVTYKCLEERNNIDPRVTRFVLPVGATINMDGTALYEAVAAIFIAQLRGIEMSAGKIVAASITATAASIGAASVPQAGIVTMVIVLTALGLPTDDVSKILAIDWLLDRFRTMINVEGDAIGAGIVAHLSRAELEALPEDKALDTGFDEGEIPYTAKKLPEENGNVNPGFFHSSDDINTSL